MDVITSGFSTSATSLWRRGHPHRLREQTAWYEVLGVSRGTSHAVRTRPTRVICFRVNGRHITHGRRQKRGALHPRRHTPQVQLPDHAAELRGDVSDRSTTGHPLSPHPLPRACILDKLEARQREFTKNGAPSFRRSTDFRSAGCVCRTALRPRRKETTLAACADEKSPPAESLPVPSSPVDSLCRGSPWGGGQVP
jgi:hypothetical protein